MGPKRVLSEEKRQEYNANRRVKRKARRVNDDEFAESERERAKVSTCVHMHVCTFRSGTFIKI